MGTTGKYSAERRSGHRGVGNVLQGNGTGGDSFRLRVLGHEIIYRKNGGRDAHRVTMADHS